MSITVLNPGLLTTVQDLGRMGYQQFGVSVSGVMDPRAAAIGNIVYDKNAAATDHAKEVFWGMDLFSYCFGSFVATAYLCLFQPFMAAWMGEKYMLPTGFVIAFALNEYVGWNHRMVGSYRAVLGRFEEDQWFMVGSAVTNLALSFALGAVWEIYEFTMDSVFGTNMQKYMLDNGTALIGQAALQDTMKDIIVDAIGALVMSTIGYISLKYKKGWVEKLTIRFHVKKPEKNGKTKRERMNEHER